MHSLRTRITLLTLCMIVIAVSLVTMVSVLFIRTNERRESNQMLLLLCETGERNLDYYFNSVQSSVRKVSTFVEADMEGLEDGQLEAHIQRVEQYFENLAYRTNGVLTYYYRIDPEVSQTVKGFWYTNTDGKGFQSHEVTDITLYDTRDTSALVWFTMPKHTGQPVWLSPYITDNLDMRVISYNVPIYWHSQFVGVVGIEIDYSDMAKQVESIRLYNSGYAFLCYPDGNLVFHPKMDLRQSDAQDPPKVPQPLMGESTFVRYTFDGVEKQAAWLPLSNGMRLVVSVPVSETEGDWQKLILEICLISAEVLVVLSVFSLFYTKRITKPLQELTAAAEQVEQGSYDFDLNYDGDDEVGRLTATFRRLAYHLKDHIKDLNQRVYVDALTSVRNKGAFNAAIERLQSEIDDSGGHVSFAIGMFDCNDLKLVNDLYGHDKGDIYLKNACRMICRVFQHSPVFRIGGDEFAVILRNEDYSRLDQLVTQFQQMMESTGSAVNRWEQVRVAVGVAAFNPETDLTAIDAVQRADQLMYANKREQKERRKREVNAI